jgi:hypothetical protein
VKYKVSLSTIVSIIVEVDAETEDEAVDEAYERAHKFAGQDHAGHNWVVDINDEWQYQDPTVETA